MSKELIVSHDSGGAEVVSAWCRANPSKNRSFLLEGPALSIFKKKLGSDLSLVSEINNPSDYDFILTGSSLFSNLERRAIKFAEINNVFCATFLDHWTQYRARFYVDGFASLPREIWVGDEYSEKLAQQQLVGAKVVRKKNYYFEEIINQAKNMNQPDQVPGEVRILYVTEPTSENAIKKYGRSDGYGYEEFSALVNYLDYILANNKQNEKIRLRLRLHPAEVSRKYDKIISSYLAKIAYDGESKNSLIEDCVWAERIVGCETMAMVIGHLIGKKVYSSMPESGPEISLPFPEIIRIFPKIK